MNVLILGAHFVNKGAEAMLLTVRQELGRRLDNPTFWFANFPLHTKPREAELARESGFRLFAPESLPGQAASLGYGMVSQWSVLRAAMTSPVGAFIVRHMRAMDAVVDASGFAFGDTWGLGPVRRTLPVVGVCAARKKPFVFLPQAWGPFTQPALAQAVRALCRRAALVYARDERSRGYLAEVMDRPAEEIELSPDIAFRFRGAEPETGAAELARLGLTTEDRHLIGLAPNMRVYERSAGIGLDNAYVSALVKTARYCAGKLGARVVLIPHETKYHSPDAKDDRYLCRLVADQFSSTGVVAPMTGEYSAAVIKSVIGHVGLLIGSRFHSIVAALSQRVPTVVLGWSHKYTELMRLFDLEEYVVDHASLNDSDLARLIEQAWTRREQNRTMLGARVPAIQAQVDGVFDHVAYVIRRINSQPDAATDTGA